MYFGARMMGSITKETVTACVKMRTLQVLNTIFWFLIKIWMLFKPINAVDFLFWTKGELFQWLSAT